MFCHQRRDGCIAKCIFHIKFVILLRKTLLTCKSPMESLLLARQQSPALIAMRGQGLFSASLTSNS